MFGVPACGPCSSRSFASWPLWPCHSFSTRSLCPTGLTSSGASSPQTSTAKTGRLALKLVRRSVCRLQQLLIQSWPHMQTFFFVCTFCHFLFLVEGNKCSQWEEPLFCSFNLFLNHFFYFFCFSSSGCHGYCVA